MTYHRALLSGSWDLSSRAHVDCTRDRWWSPAWSTWHEDTGPKVVLCHLRNANAFAYLLPARRYASAGNSDRNVSVCQSVRLSRAGIVSKRRKL